MIFIKVAPEPGSTARLRATLDALCDRIEELSPLVMEAGLACARNVITSTFVNEGASPISGAPPWDELSPITVAERVAQGFPGEHPILYRTGQLYASLASEFHPLNVTERQTMGKGSVVGRIGTRDEKFEWHQLGDDPYNPALFPRKIWPEDDYERQFMRYTENMLVHLVADERAGGAFMT